MLLFIIQPTQVIDPFLQFIKVVHDFELPRPHAAGLGSGCKPVFISWRSVFFK